LADGVFGRRSRRNITTAENASGKGTENDKRGNQEIRSAARWHPSLQIKYIQFIAACSEGTLSGF
jgi:hypothetical protein